MEKMPFIKIISIIVNANKVICVDLSYDNYLFCGLYYLAHSFLWIACKFIIIIALFGCNNHLERVSKVQASG